MRRKWSVHQHREEEAGAGGGCGTGPGEKEAWLQGSMEGRKAETLEINYTHSAAGGAKQHLPERQRHLSTTGMRTGSENFLPAEWSHPSLWGSSMRALLLLRECSGLELLPYSSQDGKEAAMFFSRWETCVSSKSHAVSFPLILDSTPRWVCCFLPPLWLGKGTLEHWPWSLQGEHSPRTFRLSFAMDQHPKELHIFSTVNVTSQPMQGCSKVQAWMVPEDTQHKQKLMPIFSTAWFSLGLIPHAQNKVLIPFFPSKAEFRSSLCLCSVSMCKWTGWQEPLNAPQEDREAQRNG